MQSPNTAYPPLTLSQPTVYGGANWNGGLSAHHNNGVLNRWFYSIVTGNRLNGNTVQGIDFDRAVAIVYRALTNNLQSSSNYADMRIATIQAAKDLNGGNGCAYEPMAIHNAWFDANLTGNPPCTNTCDFNISASSFNSNPACGSAFTLNANCSGANCGGVSYTWTGQGGVRNGQQVSYNAPNSNGSYTYTVTASNTGCSNKTANVTVNVTNCGGGNSSCANVGSISYERWNNFGGYSTDIQSFRNGTNNLQNAPSVTQSLSLFEAPTDIADQYGARIRGYVCPPTSGNYTFWVAGDDNVELWLSSNDQPSNIQRIAYHNSWTQPQQWNQFGTQQSGQINLQAGQRYYIEALVKEGGGGDNLAVGWQLPNGTWYIGAAYSQQQNHSVFGRWRLHATQSTQHFS